MRGRERQENVKNDRLTNECDASTICSIKAGGSTILNDEKPTSARVILLLFVAVIAGFVIWGVTSGQESDMDPLKNPAYEVVWEM